MGTRYRRGFTLIEILVVIVIIGVLMAIGMMSYVSAGKNARDTRRKDDLNSLQKQFELHYQSAGSYPVGSDAAACFAALKSVITTAQKPLDPDTDGEYAWDTCSASAYCLCTPTALEAQKGNSSDDACSFTDSGGTYYCVRNLQTLDAP